MDGFGIAVPEPIKVYEAIGCDAFWRFFSCFYIAACDLGQGAVITQMGFKTSKMGEIVHHAVGEILKYQ